MVRLTSVFLAADSSEPAHLSQLILLAGDVETNPGPDLCGICNKGVASNSIRCTWCGRWIHQRCSGLTKRDISQLAKSQSYRFECEKCMARWPHPGQESPEVTTRGPSPCVHPAQEPKATDELTSRGTTPTPQLHPGWEQQQAPIPSLRSILRKPEAVKENVGDRRKKKVRFSPERSLAVKEKEGNSCERPAQQNLPTPKKPREKRKRHPTEEHRKARMERRKERRMSKRQTKPTPKRESLKITTWNLQGISVHEQNRRRLRRVVDHTLKEGWEVVLISELRAKKQGVIWLGEGENKAVIVHSPRSGLILSGVALDSWVEQGQKKSFSERVTSVEIDNIRLVSVYQPLWSYGPEGIDEYRHALEDEIARIPADKTLIIGGDHNAHIGQEGSSESNGRYSLRTPTTEAGNDLLDWCLANGLQWVNSFCNMKKRGTWFNNSHRTWYELDGFIMRKKERHSLAKKMEVMYDMGLSDHNPVILHLRIPKKPRKTVTRPKPAINWEKLSNGKVADEFRKKTEDLSLQLGESTSWNEIAGLIGKAAVEVCGKRTKFVANPWTIGHEEQLAELHRKISEAVTARNEAMECELPNEIIMRKKDDLRETRRDMKRTLRTLEREWWDKLLSECQAANEKGQMGTMFRILRQLGGRDRKPDTGTTLTTSEFKTHFEKVSKDRYEVDPSSLMAAVNRMESLKTDPVAMAENRKLNEVPTAREIEKAIWEIKDSAPGKDNIRIKYIKLACPKVQNTIISIVQKMFTERATRWDDVLKTGQIVPLYKMKGSRNDLNNYRGVCLLAMGSRILAKILSGRLRKWAEKLKLLDENQSGFRSGRSTADATQIMVRITEDATDLKKRRARLNLPESAPTDPEIRLLDLRKAYPRISKPALWEILQNYGMKGAFLDSLVDLHEATRYQVRGQGQDGDSEEWTPERGLREGCSTSPCLFNIFHQVVMRLAEKDRKVISDVKYGHTGVKWRWVPGNNIPDPNKVETYNSEAITVAITSSLFADDTEVVGETREIDEGTHTTKRIMSQFEEKNNDDKEEGAVFGTSEANALRNLGSWLGPKEDLKNRLKRAGILWAKCKPQIFKSKLPKQKQAQVVETCVESGLLFDCNARPWYVRDVKKMQSWIDKRYRYIWSNKDGPPLIKMQEQHKNMQDIRNILGVKTLRWKIEKRTLERIGHVLRMSNTRITKIAVLGWLEDLETIKKCPGKKRKTLFYWRKLLREAGVNWAEAGTIAQDRKEWRRIVKNRMTHLEKWERQQAHNHQLTETVGERNFETQAPNLECPECGKLCKSLGGLKLHVKRIHTEPQCSFECPRCAKECKTESAWKNHLKKCDPSDTRSKARKYQPSLRRCRWCGQERSATNMARHEKWCESSGPRPSHEPTSSRYDLLPPETTTDTTDSNLNQNDDEENTRM